MGTDLRPPALRAAAAAGLRLLRTLPLRWRSAEATFTAIHRRNAWLGSESISGPGSSLANTAALRAALPDLLRQLGCGSLLDAPCGDFWWLKEAPLPIERYCGADIVAAVIAENQRRYGGDRTGGAADVGDRTGGAANGNDPATRRTFLCLDLRRDALPRADLILCRDCLVHLSFRDARAVLANFQASGAPWLLTTTFARHGENREATSGEWRPLNLQLAPFNLPAPATLLDERCGENEGRFADKSLGLWPLQELRLS